MFRIASALILTLLAVTTADAGPRQRLTYAHPDCNVLWPCEGVVNHPRGERIAKAVGFGAARKIYVAKATPRRAPERMQGIREARLAPAAYTRPSVSLEGVVPVLADKVREIVRTCGSQIWSTVRHTFVAGTRTLSQHASGTAVDVHGNPTCIYAMLRGWPGGYSTDYGRVNHVHISYGGREHGLRFAHGGRHYARHRHARYASR